MAKTLKSFQIIDAVILLMLKNDCFLSSITRQRDRELCELVREKFQVSTRQAQRYIKEARAEILSYNTREKNVWFQRAVRRKEFLIGKAIEMKDYRTAEVIDKDLCELLDLYPSKKAELNHSVGVKIVRDDID